MRCFYKGVDTMSVELNENSMGDLLKEFDVKRINSGGGKFSYKLLQTFWFARWNAWNPKKT